MVKGPFPATLFPANIATQGEGRMISRDHYDRLIAAYVSAHEAGDEEAIGGLFTEDAVFLDPGRPPISGRQAIQEIYKNEHMGDGIKLIINVQKFHDGGDLTFGAGTFEVQEGAGASDFSLRLFTDKPMRFRHWQT